MEHWVTENPATQSRRFQKLSRNSRINSFLLLDLEDGTAVH